MTRSMPIKEFTIRSTWASRRRLLARRPVSCAFWRGMRPTIRWGRNWFSRGKHRWVCNRRSTFLPIQKPGDPIPLAERFFAGGGNTGSWVPRNIRQDPAGYADRLPAGRLGDVFQQYRIALSVVRGEYQRRPSSKTPGTFALDVSAPSVSECNTTESGGFWLYESHAVGFGILIQDLPIGPLRLDLQPTA